MYLFRPVEGVSGEDEKLRTQASGSTYAGYFSAAIEGDRVVLGYSYHEQQEPQVPGGSTSLSGAVLLFESSGSSWSLERTIDYPGESFSAWFGSSVSLSNDRLLVGAPKDKVLMTNGDAVGSGSVFWFALGTPRELFDGWAAANGLGGSDALPLATPFGRANLLHYAFATRESGWDPDYRSRAEEPDQPFEVGFEVDPESGETTNRMVYFTRRNAGLVYTPQYCFDLVAGNWQPFTDEGVISYHDFNFNRHEHVQTFSDDVASAFGRVKVELAE